MLLLFTGAVTFVRSWCNTVYVMIKSYPFFTAVFQQPWYGLLHVWIHLNISHSTGFLCTQFCCFKGKNVKGLCEEFCGWGRPHKFQSVVWVPASQMKYLSRSLSTSKCHFSMSISPLHSVPSVSQGAINLKLQHASIRIPLTLSRILTCLALPLLFLQISVLILHKAGTTF